MEQEHGTAVRPDFGAARRPVARGQHDDAGGSIGRHPVFPGGRGPQRDGGWIGGL